MVFQALKEHFNSFLMNHRECRYSLYGASDDVDERIVLDAVNSALCHTPYYRNYEQPLKALEHLRRYPLLTKNDILNAPSKSLVSQKACKILTMHRVTGGTSGFSLDVYQQPREVLHYHQVADFAFSLIGKNLKVAQLRGKRPAGGRLFQKVGPLLLMSSYQITEQNLEQYINALRHNKISCLHVYPSSLVVLARLLRKCYGTVDLPELKGIFASSEIFSREDKLMVKDVFPGVKLVDFYGLNELCCAAVAVDLEPFRFFQDYGYVEFVDTGQELSNGNRIAQIVATSIMNKTMPLIRYATEDHVELDDEGNPLSIIGRTSDFLVNSHGQLTPCIFVNRDISFRHVMNFQYYQDTPGKLVFRVVTDGLFDHEDEKNLLTDLSQSFHDIEPVVEVVDAVEKTRIGKQKRLIQLLNLDSYK